MSTGPARGGHPAAAGPAHDGGGRRFAMLGFGALAQAFAEGLRAGGASDVAVYTRPSQDPSRQRARLAALGACSCATVEEAVADADVVIAAVPGAAAVALAERAVAGLAPGALYVDPAPLPPSAKRRLGEAVAGAGAMYADVAVIGTVNVDGHRVPMIAAGDGAAPWAAIAAPYGFRVSVLDGPAGQASLVKLLRSVYMKGRDALILEMMVAARRHGVDETVVASIGGPAEQVPFGDLVDRVMRSLAQYAGRRASELSAAAELVAEAGLPPVVSEAGAVRLRWLSELGVSDVFAGERPDSAAAVLEAIERLSPP